MTTLDRQGSDDSTAEVREVAAERLTFFVDAVIAIAITLLALDLPVPSGDTNGAMLNSAWHHFDEYLAFAISFMVVAARWNEHHRLFRYVTAITPRLTILTLTWLFMQVVTPFATKVITGDGAFQARFGLYAVLQVLASLVFALMTREVRQERLYVPGTPPDIFKQTYIRVYALVIGFAVSIPVSFLTPYSYVCWIAVPFVINFIQLRYSRQAPAM